ncbi:protein-L-isoaspartate(D-aspartate) O-methyltransferase [Candidatus Woesearchaeota archaeon]|nr:protein-L-isoaspartate(D-aspartate) O-methyltransferase [Candidatus Woesearchaeota archaeon]
MMTKEKLLAEIRMMGIKDKKVLEAIEKTPREKFIRKTDDSQAYGNYPLPIGYDQTISQPYTVAYMIQELRLKKAHKVLEIGGGSGYNAAVMSNVVGKEGKIISIERIPELVEFARKNIRKEGIENIWVVKGDGSKGYKKQSLYDRIIVTAACPKIPEALKDQLKQGGILLAPVNAGFGQEMIRLKKTNHGFEEESLGQFRFVPLVTED